MKIFGFEIRRPPRRYRIVRGPEMKQEEITEAIGSVPDHHPLLRAFLQLVDTACDNAQLQAADAADNPTKMAGYVGGCRHLMLVRDDIATRRALVLEEARKRAGFEPPEQLEG